MRTSIAYSGMIAVMLVGILGSGCTEVNNKPAPKDLSLALAGMAGSDGVSFEGSAALLREGEATPALSQYYGGKMENHNQLSLYTLLPDKGTSKTAATEGIRKLEKNGVTTHIHSGEKAYSSKLEKREGQWQELSKASGNHQDNPLPRLNPLLQLEQLKEVDKTVTEETGAARGTRVLRIQLTPEAARALLSRELEQEMNSLRPVNSGVKAKNRNQAKADKAIEALWQKKNNEMERQLAKANVKAVYHLTVDKKQNLPRKLDWTRTVSYANGKKPGDQESLVVQVNFYGYR
ncbi:hypothetical protein [Paenibacillus sp. NPDC057934]|uniref:hypothetical protein n=1 Tax=Paenibacillus sp. NPDC057934 TaxID=3346282 RepID=UPI0036DA8524